VASTYFLIDVNGQLFFEIQQFNLSTVGTTNADQGCGIMTEVIWKAEKEFKQADYSYVE